MAAILRRAARRARGWMVLPAHAPVDLTLRVGALETAVGYLLDPTSYTGSDQGQAPYFNGQRSRLDIFGGVLETCGCKSIIETGTYLGSTTKYMADTSSLPVYSCETNPVFFAIARKELAAIQNVDLYFGDSRAFLNELVSRGVHERRSFLYLDAHWNDDLPLVEEIEIIAGNWREFVVMIDDFQVPHDDGYGFDDYGPGKRLALRDLGRTFERSGLVPFFPRAPSVEESGHARGCVVLARRGELSETLDGLDVLTTAEL